MRLGNVAVWNEKRIKIILQINKIARAECFPAQLRFRHRTLKNADQ